MQKVLKRISSGMRPLLPVLLAGGMLACEAEESCVSQTTNRLTTGFFMLNEVGEAVAGAYNFEEVRALGSDSIYYQLELGAVEGGAPENVSGLEGLKLSLNPAADTTVFVFGYGSLSDTLAIRYQRTFRMISPDCGLEIRYSDLEAFRHTFDSVQVNNRELQEIATGVDVAIYSTNTCETLSTSQLDAAFYRLTENGSAVPTQVAYDEVRAEETDSLFSFGAGGEIGLQLNPLGNSTTFLFLNSVSSRIDTLQFTYVRKEVILSPECGLDIGFSGIQLSRSTFDSVSILHTELKSTEGLDVQIFK